MGRVRNALEKFSARFVYHADHKQHGIAEALELTCHQSAQPAILEEFPDQEGGS